MQEMYKRVTETLKQRAQAIRADAIIGLSVDIDDYDKTARITLNYN